MTSIHCAILAGAAMLLVGCASLSPDGGMGRVDEITRERIGATLSWQRTPADIEAAQARIRELLAQPIDADAAMQVALLGNAGLQSELAKLGIAEADLVQAGRPVDPTLSFGRVAGGGLVEVDRSVLFGVLDLLTLPAAARSARLRFEQSQWQAAGTAVEVAARARRAWIEAVAARQLATYARQVTDTAEAADELARRMEQAGNLSRLDRLRDQAFHADAAASLARAEHDALAARERLVRALGLDVETAELRLPERLPELPARAADQAAVEQAAIDQRLDVRRARQGAEATAAAWGLTKVTRFVDVLDAGYQDKATSTAPRERGFEVQLELPLFDFGRVRAARAEAEYLQALNHAAAVATDARSEVREAWSAYRTAYDIARRYRDEVVPARRGIADESLLRYNGMLVDVFQLLADSRGAVEGVMGSLQAQRDFWLAQADLQMALTGGSPAAIDASR